MIHHRFTESDVKPAARTATVAETIRVRDYKPARRASLF